MKAQATARRRSIRAVTTEPHRVAIYLRISLDRREEAGVTRQREDCLARAAREGWTVVAEFCDNNISASGRERKARPDYEEMLEAAAKGEFDIILAYSTSRLTRRPLEFEGLIKLYEDHGTLIRTIVSGDDDLSTADGQQQARIKAAIDAGQAKRIGEQVARAAQQRREQGRPGGGHRPFGFLKDRITHHPAEAEALRRAADYVIAGGSLWSVAKAWNGTPTKGEWADWRDGKLTTSTGREWTASQLRQVLLRPRNAGLMEDGDGNPSDIRATWEPILTGEQHDALRLLLTDPSRLTHGGVSRKLVGSGVYVCASCGKRMRSGGNSARGEARYMCTAPHPCTRRRAEPIDLMVRGVIVEYLNREGVRLLPDSGPDLSEEKSRLAALRAASRELPGLVGAGIMTVGEFKAAKARNEEEIAALQVVVERGTGVSPLTGVADADDAGAAFLAAEPDRQRAIIAELVSVAIVPLGVGKRFTPDTVQITPREQ